jgi:threonine dehydratase
VLAPTPRSLLPSLADFEQARLRIARATLRTPTVQLRAREIPAGVPAIARGIAEHPVLSTALSCDLLLKLECLQVTGSFKARGAMNRVLALDPETARRGLVTASGGNHGLAVAYAGRAIDVPTTVFLPGRTSEAKAARIERWGAQVVRAGDVWDDAHAAALEHAARTATTYIHPFADPLVVAGQGTLSLEILEAAPDTDAFVVAIGGGGLAAGVAAAARALRPGVRVIGVEPVGAPTLHESLRAREVIELREIATRATTLAPRRTDAYNLGILEQTLDDVVLVTDDEMRHAARFLFDELGVGVELSGAAAVAAVLSRKAPLDGVAAPCALVCGAGTDALPHTP